MTNVINFNFRQFENLLQKWAVIENAPAIDDDEEYESEISIDNGCTFMSAAEIDEKDLNEKWFAIENLMDDEIRESVARDFAPCSEREFLTEYLKRSPENLVIG